MKREQPGSIQCSMKPSSERFVARRTPEETGTFRRPDMAQFIGVDAGAETLKLIELQRCGTELRVTRKAIVEHGKKPGPVLVEALRRWDWRLVTGAAVSGRFASQFNLLALRELGAGHWAPLDPARSLAAKVEQKDTFVCGSTRGCGGAGNHCHIERLEERGLRVQLSPITEWLNYCAFLGRRTRGNRLADRLRGGIQQRIEATAFAAMAPHLGLSEPPATGEALEGARPYLNDALEGEAVLTVGAPLHTWRRGQIDATISVGPLECMPTKIAEAQFHHVSEREGLLSLTLSFNGDPINTAAVENFAFEVKERCQRRHALDSERVLR